MWQDREGRRRALMIDVRTPAALDIVFHLDRCTTNLPC
jgi:hypothetical protein